MGVVELLQQKAFLGREFLTWLWHHAERRGQVRPRGAKAVTIEILGPILLDAQYGDARVSTLKGESPATAPEAGSALLEGKKLVRAKMKWARDDAEWTVTLDGESFNIGGLNVPNPGKLPFEDYMALRLAMVLEFEQVLEELFQTFIASRMDERAWAAEVKEIQQWVREKASLRH